MRLIDADALGVGRCSRDILPDAYCAGWNGLIHIINSAPTINPDDLRERGRWEQCFEDWRMQIEGDKCSGCGFEYYGSGIRRYHYCPNCGAKMDAEDINVPTKTDRKENEDA